MLISSSRFAAAAVLVCLASLKHAAAAAPQLAWSNPVIKAIPKGKVAFGVNVDITHGRTDNIQSPADAQARFGQQLAIFGIFVDVDSPASSQINNFHASLADPNAIIMITAMPGSESGSGIRGFTSKGKCDGNCLDLVSVCKQLNSKGRNIIMRFAHEMNGDWYVYGGERDSNKQELFLDAFKNLADALHASAPLTAVMWSPNHVEPLAADAPGYLFEHYWPGDGYVDVLGISAYYYGTNANSNGDPNTASDGEKGSHNPGASNVLEDMLDNDSFYQTYVIDKNLPFILAETGIAVYPSQSGANAATLQDFKISYMKIIQAAASRKNFIGVCYFDLNKPSEQGRDFSISNAGNEKVLSFIKSNMIGAGQQFIGSGQLIANSPPNPPVCQANTMTCQGSDLMQCNADGTALTKSVTCANGCAQGKCTPLSTTISTSTTTTTSSSAKTSSTTPAPISTKPTTTLSTSSSATTSPTPPASATATPSTTTTSSTSSVLDSATATSSFTGSSLSTATPSTTTTSSTSSVLDSTTATSSFTGSSLSTATPSTTTTSSTSSVLDSSATLLTSSAGSASTPIPTSGMSYGTLPPSSDTLPISTASATPSPSSDISPTSSSGTTFTSGIAMSYGTLPPSSDTLPISTASATPSLSSDTLPTSTAIPVGTTKKKCRRRKAAAYGSTIDAASTSTYQASSPTAAAVSFNSDKSTPASLNNAPSSSPAKLTSKSATTFHSMRVNHAFGFTFIALIAAAVL